MSGLIGLGGWVSTGAGAAAASTKADSDAVQFNSGLALYPTRALYRCYLASLFLSVANWWAHDWGQAVTLVASFGTVLMFMLRIRRISP